VTQGCTDFAEATGLEDVSCCSSCHEDCYEYGMDMLYVTLDGQEYDVCCTLYNAWKGGPKLVRDLAKALVQAQRERDEALALAYIGEHRFPDLTWKSRAEEAKALLQAVAHWARGMGPLTEEVRSVVGPLAGREVTTGWSYAPIGPGNQRLGPDDKLVCPDCMVPVNSRGGAALVGCPSCGWSGHLVQCFIAKPSVDWKPLNMPSPGLTVDALNAMYREHMENLGFAVKPRKPGATTMIVLDEDGEE
jgi:hypothetical protein